MCSNFCYFPYLSNDFRTSVSQELLTCKFMLEKNSFLQLRYFVIFWRYWLHVFFRTFIGMLSFIISIKLHFFEKFCPPHLPGRDTYSVQQHNLPSRTFNSDTIKSCQYDDFTTGIKNAFQCRCSFNTIILTHLSRLKQD